MTKMMSKRVSKTALNNATEVLRLFTDLYSDDNAYELRMTEYDVNDDRNEYGHWHSFLHLVFWYEGKEITVSIEGDGTIYVRRGHKERFVWFDNYEVRNFQQALAYIKGDLVMGKFGLIPAKK